MKTIRLLALTTFALGAGAAHAGVYIEPYGGYLTGESKTTIAGLTGGFAAANGTTTTKGKGWAYGARAGYGFGHLVFGADYGRGIFNPTDATEAVTKSWDLGAFVMWRFPFHVNLYGAYTFANDITDVKGSGGYKGGIGFRILPFVNLNAEYVVQKYDDLDNRAGSPAAMTVDGEAKSWVFTLSLPFEIGMKK